MPPARRGRLSPARWVATCLSAQPGGVQSTSHVPEACRPSLLTVRGAPPGPPATCSSAPARLTARLCTCRPGRAVHPVHVQTGPGGPPCANRPVRRAAAAAESGLGVTCPALCVLCVATPPPPSRSQGKGDGTPFGTPAANTAPLRHGDSRSNRLCMGLQILGTAGSPDSVERRIRCRQARISSVF